MNPKTLVGSLVAAALIGSAIGYSAGTSPLVTGAGGAAMRPATSGRAASGAQTIALPNFEALAARYGPAVVNVTVTEAPQAESMPQLDPDDPAFPFFRRFGIPAPEDEPPAHGVGSGFIVSSDGVILTNAHVVDGARQVDVKLVDKREYRARVVGVDKQSDIAVLKIQARNLPTVKLGDPAELKPGDWVVAIGSPFGFENTVTKGIVSAKSRSLPDETYVPFIQTDVPVNPGNSGGPLFDMKGEVVGINAQIYSNSGGYEGLSFAIPIDIAVNVEHQILAHGHVTRGRLGVTVQDMTQGLAESFDLKSANGALVSAVDAGGPAAKGGLKQGDVILAFNGKAVVNSADLPVEVAALQPGTSVELEVYRAGRIRHLEVTLGRLQNTVVAEADTGGRRQDRIGLAVRQLSPEERDEVGAGNGLLVEDVAGAAAQAGIRPGDVIVAMNGTPLKSARQFGRLLAKAGKHVALLVQRDDVRIFVPIDLS